MNRYLVIKRAGQLLMSLFFLFFFTSSLLAQDQQLADSLKKIYEKGELEDKAKLELLRNLAFNENNLALSLKYAEELILQAKASQNQVYEFDGYLQKGYKKSNLGDFNDALEAFIMAMQIAQKIGHLPFEGTAYCAIADLYSELDNHNNAIEYYHKAIKLLRKTDDPIALASTIMNAGDEYLKHEQYDSALFMFEESGKLFEENNYLVGKAYILGNIGMVYANTGKHQLAEKNMGQAVQILEQAGDYYPICFYLIYIADIYFERGNIAIAIRYAQRSLSLAKNYKLKQQISDAHLKLSELYEAKNQLPNSLEHYKSYITYRDSVKNLETIQQMADQRTTFEVNLRETEIDVLEKEKKLQQNYVMITIILLALSVVVLLYFRQRFINTRLVADNERKQHDVKIKDLLKSQETKALQAMIKGKDQERKHLAKELHNHLGSLLATVKVNLNGLDSPDLHKHQTVISLVDQACQDVRNISHELNMGVSESFGLVPALQELMTHLRQSGELTVEFIAVMDEYSLDSENEIIIYRIIQELVSNVLKHAAATKLSVHITFFPDDNLINILVEDNGKGFDSDTITHQSNGIGVVSLKEMVKELEGEIIFDSHINKGTTVNIDLPISSHESIE